MSDQHWDEVYDFVAIGSGGASMCAALVAKDAGKRVLILEKQFKVGGSTGFSGGCWWIPNNPLMAAEGIADSFEEGLQYFESSVAHKGPGTSPARRKAFLKTGPEMISYLLAKGMKIRRPDGWADYYDNLPGGKVRSRALIPEMFDINQLGEWTKRLAIYPGPAIRFRFDSEFPSLLLMKRAWKGKFVALKVGFRILKMKLLGQDLRGNGAAMQGRMLQILLREGVPIWPETPVDELIVDNSRVVGVVAKKDGKSIRIQAKDGVLIGAGGFSRSAEMRKQYGRQPSSANWTLANPGDTGEMMQKAIALGAATDCMDTAIWGAISLGPNEALPEGAFATDGSPLPFSHHFDISMPHAIFVDQDGQRFANESGSYMDIGEAMYENHVRAGRNIPGWAIIESRHRARYLWGTVMGKSKPSWFEDGYMIRADSVEELAAKCSIDPAKLKASIERFNGFARAGVDEDFKRGGKAFDRYHGDWTVKPNPNLGAIEQPPFFACRIYPGDVGTYGGLVTDEHGRVLRGDGKWIEGLYAAGSSAASVTGRTYIGAGASIGPAYVFGYRAAHHAVGKPL